MPQPKIPMHKLEANEGGFMNQVACHAGRWEKAISIWRIVTCAACLKERRRRT